MEESRAKGRVSNYGEASKESSASISNSGPKAVGDSSSAVGGPQQPLELMTEARCHVLGAADQRKKEVMLDLNQMPEEEMRSIGMGLSLGLPLGLAVEQNADTPVLESPVIVPSVLGDPCPFNLANQNSFLHGTIASSELPGAPQNVSLGCQPTGASQTREDVQSRAHACSLVPPPSPEVPSIPRMGNLPSRDGQSNKKKDPLSSPVGRRPRFNAGVSTPGDTLQPKRAPKPKRGDLRVQGEGKGKRRKVDFSGPGADRQRWNSHRSSLPETTSVSSAQNQNTGSGGCPQTATRPQ